MNELPGQSGIIRVQFRLRCSIADAGTAGCICSIKQKPYKLSKASVLEKNQS